MGGPSFYLLLILMLLPIGCTKKKRPTLNTYITESEKMKAALGYQKKALGKKGIHRSEALLRAARLYLEIRDNKNARATLGKIVADKQSTPRTRGRALYLLCKHWGKYNSCLMPIIIHYPDTVAAEDSLLLYLPLLERKGIEQFSHQLSALYMRLKKTNLADNILYRLGKRLSAEEGKGNLVLFGKSVTYAQAAWVSFDLLLKSHPNSSLRDDAIYDGSKVLHRLGRIKEAISLLSTFLKARSSSWFFGEYNSQLMDDAWLLCASLHIENGNFSKGFSMLLGLPKEFPTSRLRDDAHYKAVMAAIHAQKTSLACSAMASFLKKYKRSRHYPTVRRLRTRCERKP
ncbi:tetratricopeptide repeat protein [Myxococcota bacterium]|nr:tetratricopeptide repeat protein [Myxococcota bacterium]MBU1534222.1 tetratricopeptide repeat protein [Myxococcota bacterium]